MNMKKLVILLSIISFTIIAIGQNKGTAHAYLEGYKTNDTIRIDDLIRVGEISIDNNSFSVVNFKLVFIDGGFLAEYKSSSNKFTEEMKNALLKLKTRNTKSVKILFEDIIVLTPENTKSNIGILLFKVKIK